MLDLHMPSKFSDRFIPRRDNTDFDLSYHFINHSTGPKVSDDHSVKPISEDTFLNTIKHTYNTSNYCNILKKLLLKNQSRILNFAAPKHISIDNTHIRNIPEQHLWPVVARQRPLLGPPSIVLDMPNINRFLNGQVVDWGSKGHIATTYEGEVHLWHPEKVLSRRITETNGKVRECVKWNKYGTHFAMALSLGMIAIYDLELHKIIAKARCNCSLNCVISSIQWMSNDSLITGCSLGRLCYWSSDLKLISTYPKAHNGQIINIRISCRENCLVTAGNDDKVKTWLLSELAENFEMWFSLPVTAVDWHPWKEGLLAVGGPTNTTIWNVNNRKPLDFQNHPHPNSFVDALTFNPNSAELLVSYYALTDEGGVNYLTVLKNLKHIVDEVQYTSGRVPHLLWDCTGTKVAKQIYQKIKAKGPMTVADYMRDVLTNPVAGYYMHKDMFGDTGDFITSPEVSQMFGEMIAVWLLNEWQKMGSPKPLQLIELGPGRGTLSNDILNVFSHFKALHKTSLHLVEISPTLSDMQARRLCTQSHNCNPNNISYKTGITNHGIPVHWYKELNDVPECFTLLIAHEFFDALPINKFHRTYSGYREVLIDIDDKTVQDKNAEPKFRYVLSRNETPMCKTLLSKDEKRDHVEISSESILIYRQICERIKSLGGIGLICDYGHYGTGTDTFRAFKKHKQVDPLVKPGTADLTADVDFKLIRKVAEEVDGIITYGPATQRDFLLRTGLEFRFNTLCEKIENQRHLENLTECYKILVDKDKMGERFKFCALFPETIKKILDKCPVVGFL